MPRPISDPTALRALAHPLRQQILEELDVRGPMRAADVARVLNIPANQASFHLRQLAKYGFVEEDPGAAKDRRDRVWRETGGTTVEMSEVEKQPGGRAASRAFRSQFAQRAHAIIDEALSDERTAGRTGFSSASLVRLTVDEVKELADEVAAVVERFGERHAHDADDADDADGVQVFSFIAAMAPRVGD